MSLVRWLHFLSSLVPAASSWGVSYPEALSSITGSCVVFPCTLSFPSSVSAAAGIVAIWYKDYEGQKTVVFHSEGQGVDARFRGRAQLLGDPAAHNCTLLLRGVTPEDSGPYRFRFEIVDGDRWSAVRDVLLRVSDAPERPIITTSEEVLEGTPVTLECSSPYVCPLSDVSLRWAGYDPQVSAESGSVQLDPAGVGRRRSLTTSFSWHDHSRMLLCEVLHGSQRASAELELRVRHAPKGTAVSLSPSTRNVHVGDTVSFSCTVSSSHPPVAAYRWYRDRVAVGTERVLTLRAVRPEDHGRYHCEAENAVGVGEAPAVMLYVLAAEVSISPAAEVQEGTTTTLSCETPGQEGWEQNYTWYRNGAWLQQGPAHTLLFPRVAASDGGFYSCKVTNEWGSTVSPAASLSVTYPPRAPTLTLLQEPQGGGLAVLHCTVDSHPPATLSLYHDGTLLATSTSQAAPGPRLSITSTRNALRLELRAVQPRDGGQYRCTATNAMGNATATRPFVPRATRVLVHPAAEVREGEDVTLSCVAPGDTLGPATYTWYRNGRRLAGGTEPLLHLPSIRSEDGGAFQCQAQGRGDSGDSDTSVAVMLRVLFPPRQPVLSSFLQTQGGQLGIIQCTVQSEPEALLTLWHGDEAVACTRGCPPAPSARLRATPSSNSLRLELRDVVLQDEGTYVCRAENEYGNASAALAFSAETARVVVSPSPHVLEGHAANLTCQVSSDPGTRPNVTWYRDGQELPVQPDTALVLPRVTSGDAGLYHCTATTGSSSRSSSAVLLDVLYPPRDAQLTAFLETQRGRLAIFRGSVASNPPAQLALYRGTELVASSSGGGHSPSPRVSATATPNALRAEVREVTTGDEGSYRLTATNAYGSATQSLFFRVQAARVLVVPSAEVLEGDDVSLTCEVPGVPHASTVFSWYKDSVPVHESPDSVLVLPRVTSTATGSYHCAAHGPEGTATSVSPAVTLRVLYPPRVPVLSTLLEAPGGRGAVLQCLVDSQPPAQLRILKDGALVASSAPSPSATAPRLSVTAATNSLRVSIAGVRMEDEGEYVCSASNAYGNASTAGNLTAGTARLWILPSPDVREGDAVNLTCVADSSTRGTLTYTWYKDGAWLSTSPDPTITLPSVAAPDAGSYHCVVQGPPGTRSTAPRTLRVLYPPRSLQLKSFSENSGGRAVILLCTVDSSPPADISLHRDGRLLASSAAAGPRSPNALRMELPAATARDEGEYECWARSPLGSTRTSVHLRVQAIRVQVLPATEVHEGTAVTLSCEDTASHPGTIYTWFKNGRWLQEGPSATLLLPAARSSDAGSYSCAAREGPGSQRAPPADLRVLYAPRQPSLVALVEPQGGQHAELLCRVDSQPPASMLLLHGRVPLASTRDPQPPAQAAPNALRVQVPGPGAEGLYVCVANNSLGTATTSLLLAASGVQVTVEPSPEVPEGATATMNCSAGPWLGAEANYTWYKDHQWLREGPDSSLVLAPVSSTDAGFYHCQATGTRGRASSAPLSLSVLYAPRDVSISTFLENRRGQAGIVLCTASSHPPAALALFRRGRLLASSLALLSSPGLRAVTSPNALRLEMDALGPGDAAEYTCVASNALGNATASAYFDIHTLSLLLTFTAVAGLLLALVAAVLLALVILVAARLWPRLRRIWAMPRTEAILELSKKEELMQVDAAS